MNYQDVEDDTDDLTVTVAPHDYTDSKNRVSTDGQLQVTQTMQPQHTAALKKVENKLKRLADLGDINASKQTQIYLEALGEVGRTNPHLSSLLELVQTGLSQQF